METSDQSAGIPLVPVPRQAGIAAADVQRQKVMLAMPWYKSSNPLTTLSMMQLFDKRRMSTTLCHGDAFVSHSRSKCVDAFLASDMEWLLMIDDDMVLPFGPHGAAWYNACTGFNLPEKFAGMHAVDRLLSHGKSLIGGSYWGRHKYGSAMWSEAAANPVEAAWARKGPYDEIRKTRWCATGCLLINRQVFLDIEKRFPRLGRQVGGKGGSWFAFSEHKIMDVVDRTRAMLAEGQMDGTKAMKAYEMLEAGAADARRNSPLGQGEDVSFNIRAAESGHQPFVDLGLCLGHISGSTVYGPYNTAPKPK